MRLVFGITLSGVGILLALVSSGMFFKVSAQPAGKAPSNTAAPEVVRMVGPVSVNQDLRNLPYIAPKEEFDEQVLTRYPHPGAGQSSSEKKCADLGENLVKNALRPAPTIPGPLLTFEGVSFNTSMCGCLPPDTDGDVGPNHYIEAVNSSFQIFAKDGTTLAGPTSYNSLFAPLVGTPCSGFNDGDPYVLYDHLADRWLVSDFAFPSFPGSSFWQCIAVSKTSDPVSGGWFLYAVQVDPGNPTFLGDYPKMAMWDSGGTPAQNAYFLTMNLFSSPVTFNGVRAYALDRASMLSGGPANAIGFTVGLAGVGDSYSFVAATFRTGDPPPAGRNGMVLAIDSPASGGVTLTQVHARFFHVDFATPANSTFGVGINHTPNAEITVNGFIDAFTNSAGFTVIPQLGTTQKIQSLGDKIMTPVVYQNRSGTESLWASSTVCTDANCVGQTGVRWYQFNVTGGTFPAAAAQQQTWTNGGDGVFRFMPSIAVDNCGDAAIGYSSSSSTMFPGIRYAGRLAGDPLNDLGQGEAVMFAGGGSQTSTSARWGDYSMTTVDPADGLTFWHANEYHLVTSGAIWHTRIGSFKFGDCGTTSDTVTISKARYSIARSQLSVVATDSDPSAVLTVKVTSTGEVLGTMDTRGDGRYRLKKNGVANPMNVTVTSNLGGSDSANVQAR